MRCQIGISSLGEIKEKSFIILKNNEAILMDRIEKKVKKIVKEYLKHFPQDIKVKGVFFLVVMPQVKFAKIATLT